MIKSGFIRRSAWVAAAILLGLWLDVSGFLTGLDHYLYDFSFRIRGSDTPHPKLMIVAIDERTLAQFGPWPLPRHQYVSLLDRLGGAAAVGIDIIMTEITNDDAVLAQAIERQGKTVLPVYIDEQLQINRPKGTLGKVRTGHVHLEEGVDGVLREIYHTITLGESALPSFPSVVWELASGKQLVRQTLKKDRSSPGELLQTDPMRINFCGPPATVPRVSFLDVVEGKTPPSIWMGKIVLVGTTVPGPAGLVHTPFGVKRRGLTSVEVQANVIDTLLKGNAIRVLPPEWCRLLAVSLAILLALLLLSLNERWAFVFGLSILFLLFIVGCTALGLLDIWLSPGLFLVLCGAVLVTSYGIKFSEALAGLDRAYNTLFTALRWPGKEDFRPEIRKGFRGIFSLRALQGRIQLLQDVMQQLKLEKEFSDAALFSDFQGVILFGPQGNRLLANTFLEDLCRSNGMTVEPAESFFSALSRNIMADVGQPLLPDSLSQFTQGARFLVELARPKRRFFSVQLSLLQASSQRFFLFVFWDITQTKELELLKSQLVSTVAHELKTPLTSIQGFSELLSLGLEGSMKDFATIIHDEAVRLRKFIDALLDVTRIEAGKQTISRTAVHLIGVIGEVAAILSPIAKNRNITLHLRTEGITRPILADRNLVKQCLINLIENAIKYSPPERQVIVQVEEIPGISRIQVVDQGFGIPLDDLDRIFQKFYRSKASEVKRLAGFGLGLAFVKQAVEAQEGRISVVSQEGRGSTFTMEFPQA